MNILNEKQDEAFKYVKWTKYFYNWSGGSGKSHVINLFVNYYKNNIENLENKLYVTSSTGLSSLLINGITINQYAGIGTGEKDVEYYVKNIQKKPVREEQTY